MLRYLFTCLFLSFISTTLSAQCASPSSYHDFCVNGKNYRIVKEKKPWSSAALCAQQMGGYLAEIESQAEQTALYAKISSEVPSNYTTVSYGGGIAYVWIGATDLATEGTWLWDGDGDGSGVNFWNGQGSAGTGGGSSVGSAYQNWGNTGTGPNEPDNFLSMQHAAGIALSTWPQGAPPQYQLGFAGQWNDISDTNSLYFVVEFDTSVVSGTLNVNSCGDYISPSGNHLWNASGTYYDTLQNTAGCDSILEINLTITNLDTIVNQNLGVLTASQTGASYQWLDCNNAYAILLGDTSQQYEPLVTGSYAVEITLGNCKDTSSCHTVTITSVRDLEYENMVTVSPNPNDGNLVISNLTGMKIEKLSIFSSTGQLLQQHRDVVSTIYKFNITEQSGVYLLEMIIDGRKITRRVIVLL